MRSAVNREFIRRATPVKTRATHKTSVNCFANYAGETSAEKNRQRGSDASSRWHKKEKCLELLKAWSKETLLMRPAETAVSVTIRFFNQMDSHRRLPKWRPN